MDKIFRLQPWTPQLRHTAEDVIGRIHGAIPECEVLFMGAAALGLPGKNDIDLDILCDVSDIDRYTELLTPILGEPKDNKDSLTTWECAQDGYEIDAILSDPRTSHVPRQRAVFEKLKSDPASQAIYLRLKQECDGLPYEVYERRKKEFFTMLLTGG